MGPVLSVPKECPPPYSIPPRVRDNFSSPVALGTIKDKNSNGRTRFLTCPLPDDRCINDHKDFALRQAQCERYNSYFEGRKLLAQG